MEHSATERRYLPSICNHDPYIKEHVVNVEGVRNTQRILIGKPRAHVRYVWARMKENIEHNVPEIR